MRFVTIPDPAGTERRPPAAPPPGSGEAGPGGGSGEPTGTTTDADAGELIDRAARLSRRNSFRIGLVVGVVLTVAVVMLILQNGHAILVNWGWLHFSAPLWGVLLVTLAAGIIVGRLVPATIRRGRHRRQERREALEQARRAVASH